MEHHKEGYEEDVVMPSDHDSTSGSEDESFTLDSITSSNVWSLQYNLSSQTLYYRIDHISLSLLFSIIMHTDKRRWTGGKQLSS